MRFVRRLHDGGKLALHVFSGAAIKTDGYKYSEEEAGFPVTCCGVPKRRFGVSPSAALSVAKLIRSKRPAVVMMPIEKKLLGMIGWIWLLRLLYRFDLVSYNHACLRSTGRVATNFDMWLSGFLFRRYDRIIFYTQDAREFALSHQLVNPSRSYFANNTLDTTEIFSLANDAASTEPTKRILFIGRLIANKRVDLFLKYHAALAELDSNIECHIIGDGPESKLVAAACSDSATIHYHGAIVDENAIASHINLCHAVFVPGASGLAIVHAFAYGKPYITIRGDQFTHGPEFSYLQDGVNGLVLDKLDFQSNVKRIYELLSNQTKWAECCRQAKQTALNLSVDQWCDQMTKGLLEAQY